MHKAVSVIILNYNTPIHTANCVESFLKYCDKSLFDIIIADNGSTDGSLPVLKNRFPEVIYIDNKQNLGFAGGNNTALKYSIDNGYEYALLTNSDTIIDDDIITTLKAHLDNRPNAAAVQPAIYWMHKPTMLWNGPGFFNKLLGNTVSKTSPRYKFLPSPLKVDWVTGCCVLLRNKALQQSGLFNERFFLYYEDAELSFRLRRWGYELLYITDAKIYHEAGVSGKVKSEEGFLKPVIHYYTSRNRLWFIRRYGAPAFLPVNFLYNLCYFGMVWIYLTLRNRKQKAAFLQKGIKEGLLTPKAAIFG